MSFERQKGLTFSALLHLLVLAFAIWGLPELFNRTPPPEPQAITVELLPIGKISNVKNTPKPKPKKEEPKKPQPPVKKPDEKPAPPPPPVEKKEEKKEVKKEKKKEKKKPKKKKEEDLAAVLAAVKETAQKEKNKPDDDGHKSRSDQYDPTLPLSISEKDAIRSQFIQCWSVPAGAKDAHELVVTLRVEVELSGAVRRVELADSSKSRYASDTFFRAAADSAIRAVHRCSPLKNLPADKYATWRDMELTFDPKEMLY